MRIDAVVLSLLLALGATSPDASGYDPAYGNQGRVKYCEVGGVLPRIASLRLDDGRLVIAVSDGAGTNSSRILMIRIRADGTFDNSFGSSGPGYTVLPALRPSHIVRGIARTHSGRFAVVGDDGIHTLVVYEVTDGGLSTLATTFNFNASNGDPRAGLAEAIAVLPGGKLLVAGKILGANGWDLAVARLNENLTRDTSFGSLGTYAEGFGFSGLGDDTAVALQPAAGGRVLVAGNSRDTTTSRLNAVVVQLLENGTPDPAFGNFGAIYFTNGSRSAAAQALRIDGQGRILVAGWIDGVNTADFWIHRLLSSGASDFSFGSGANAVIPFDLTGSPASDLETITSMDVDLQGRILAGGIAIRNAGSQQHAAVAARLGANGTLDAGFASAGRFVGTFAPPGDADPGNAVAAIHGTPGGVVMVGFTGGCAASLRVGGDALFANGFEAAGGP